MDAERIKTTLERCEYDINDILGEFSVVTDLIEHPMPEYSEFLESLQNAYDWLRQAQVNWPNDNQ